MMRSTCRLAVVLVCLLFSHLCLAECYGIEVYNDMDNDSFGDSSGEVFCAEVVELYFATNNLDCNDNDASIYPGAEEICNGIDNNCNGVIGDGLCAAVPIAASISPSSVPLPIALFPTSYFTTISNTPSTEREYQFDYTQYIPSSGPGIGNSSSLVPSLFLVCTTSIAMTLFLI